LHNRSTSRSEGFGYFIGISSISVYGGGDGATWDQQRRALEGGADIVIATTGRLMLYLRREQLCSITWKHLILDEADRMLDMGFYDDIVKIITTCQKKNRRYFFQQRCRRRSEPWQTKILKSPTEINISVAKPAAGILQQAYVVYDAQKPALIKHVLKSNSWSSVIIFASTKRL
jgi:superfamily II DNA/RNA helicase